MNKKLLVIAVAGVMAMPLAANAGGKHKVYGATHISVDQLEDTKLVVHGGARKANKIGMKGSMDTNVADFKAVYQIEAGMAIGEGSSPGFFERDSWVGLSSKSMGTVRLGTMATHYKQMGKATDALFTTSAEGRGLIKTQSKQHSGFGPARGRADQMIRYDSPSISGAKVIAHYQVVQAMEDNMGLGLQYKAGNYLAFFDYINFGAAEKTAMKVGGKAKFGPASLALQYEIDDDGSIETVSGGENQLHVQGTYSMGATTLILTVGNNSENTGYAVAVSQKVAKKASVYVGYAASGGDETDSSAITAGMKVAFGK